MLKTISKTVVINATPEKIWEVLFSDRYNRIWYAEFNEGTYAKTDWKEGSPVWFLAPDGSGLAGRIVKNDPYKELTLVYTGEVKDGKEDITSESADAIKGGRESYYIRQTGEGVSELRCESDMDANFYEMMSAAFDRALVKIRNLAESKSEQTA